MATTIHQLRAIVTSDIQGFLSGMGQVSRATISLKQQWMDTANAIATAGMRITSVIAGIGAYAAKEFADFEDVMVEVGAITRTLGTKDFKLLEKAALDMGEQTRYSATEAAGALKQLSLAGLGTTQSIEALPPTLELAAAAGISIAQAAGIAAKTMKAFGMEASQLAHVNDVLVSTFTRANTDLVQLSEGLKHVAPLAKVLNVSLEDTTAVLAKLADAGFQGEMGGTALRNILSRLSGAMPDAMGKLSRLGITTLDTTGKMRPMLDVLEDIEKKGLTAGQVMEIFGQRGGPQLLALLEQGIGAVREFSKETEKAAGVANRMMEARMATLKGQFDQLTSMISSTFIDMGAEIAPILTKLMNETEGWIRANKPEIIANMRTMLVYMIDALRDLLKWIQVNRVELGQWATALAQAVRWIAEFVGRHPQVLLFFAAFQAGRILGINTALFQTIGLVRSLIVELGKLILKWAAVGAAQRAAGAAGGVAGAVGGAAGAAGGAGAGGLGAAAGGAGLGLVIAKAGALGIILAELGVVAWQLDQIFHALARAVERGEKALNKQLEDGKKTVSDKQDLQIEAIRRSRLEKAKADGEDPGSGFVVNQLQERLGEEKDNLARRQAELAKRQQEQRAAQEAHNAALMGGNAAEITKTESNLDQRNSGLMNAQNLVENTKGIVGKLTTAITEELGDTFNQVRDQVKDKGLRKTFSDEMTALKDQFASGAIPAEEFRKRVEKLTEDLKKAGEDSMGTKPFNDLAKTKRAMKEGGGSTVDFEQFDAMKGALAQLNNVDKLWAEEIAARAADEMAIVEEMRRTQGDTQAVRDAEAALSERLKQIEAEAREATSAIVTDKLTQTQKEQALQRRKDASGGYEDFSNQTNEMLNAAGGIANGGLKNVSTNAIRQLAKGLAPAMTEGDKNGEHKVPILTKELEDEFVKAFEDLKAKGPQKFAEGIEELTVTFTEKADKLKANAEELSQALSDLAAPGGMDNRIGELKALHPDDTAYAAYEKLKERARANQIGSDEFNRGTDRISTSLETGQSAREGVNQQRDSVVESATNQAKQFSTDFGQKFVDGIKAKMDEAVTKFNEEMAKLQQEFLDSDMSVDEFNRRLGLLKDGMDKVGQAALDAANKAQREAIMKGDFSSINLKDEWEKRLFAFQMQRFNALLDAQFNAYFGINQNLNQFGQGLNQANQNLNQWGQNLGGWFEDQFGGGGGGGFGGGGGAFGGLTQGIAGGLAMLNSASGQIANLTNQIADLAQVLQLPNVTGSRKEEIKRQIEDLQNQISYLSQAPAPMFVGSSGDPLFRDPGLIGTGGGNRGTAVSPNFAAANPDANLNGQQRSQITTTVNFPNVNKFTSADADLVFDALERVAQRRGKRLV